MPVEAKTISQNEFFPLSATTPTIRTSTGRFNPLPLTTDQASIQLVPRTIAHFTDEQRR